MVSLTMRFQVVDSALRASSTGVGRTWRSSSVCQIRSMISASLRSWRRRAAADPSGVGTARMSAEPRSLSSTERRLASVGWAVKTGLHGEVVDDLLQRVGAGLVSRSRRRPGQPAVLRRLPGAQRRAPGAPARRRWPAGSRSRRRGPGRWPARGAGSRAVRGPGRRRRTSSTGRWRRPRRGRPPWIPWSAGAPARRGPGAPARAGGPGIHRGAWRRGGHQPGVRRQDRCRNALQCQPWKLSFEGST